MKNFKIWRNDSYFKPKKRWFVFENKNIYLMKTVTNTEIDVWQIGNLNNKSNKEKMTIKNNWRFIKEV